MFTIAELPEYIRRADKLMILAERIDIVNYLAAHPKAWRCDGGHGSMEATLRQQHLKASSKALAKPLPTPKPKAQTSLRVSSYTTRNR
jgi:hypothetical protein